MKRSKNFDVIAGYVLFGSRPVLAIVLAMIVAGGLIALQGKNPILAYSALIKGAFGSISGLANTGVRATPLLLGALSFSIASRAGVWNVGVEGQIYMGALGATIVAIMPLSVSPFVHVLLSLIAAAIFGALWALIPAYLRAYKGISEIVTNLMLNYTAVNIISYMITNNGPLAKPNAFFPQSPSISKSAELPLLISGTSLHVGFIIGIVLCLIMFLVLGYTPIGFKTRLVGANPIAADYSGINVRSHILTTLCFAGSLGGLAGAGEILGLRKALYEMFSGGLGYDGVAVGLLSAANPLGVIISSLFFGGLKAGSSLMQQQVGVSTHVAQITQALGIFFLMGIGFAKAKKTGLRLDHDEALTQENLANKPDDMSLQKSKELHGDNHGY